MRGTSNSNQRGSSTDRKRRKIFLLNKFGDGTAAPCAFCLELVDFDTITVDRHPIAGVDGGRYTRDNIRPACAKCNSADGARIAKERRVISKV